MRGKRSKQYRKLMQRYALTFGFREPYQVLVDAAMLQDTYRFKMDLVQQLSRTLHGQIKPMITQCSIRHLYALSTSSSISSPLPEGYVSSATKTALLQLSRTLTLRRCSHHTLSSPLSSLACISSVLDPSNNDTNKHRLVLACQDETVRRWARTVKGVPCVYVKRSVMVMEPMGDGSLGVREGMERYKLRAGAKRGLGMSGVGEKRKRDNMVQNEGQDDGDKGVIGQYERAMHGEGEEKEKKGTKARGPKGPNPLSVKKKKKGRDDGGRARRKIATLIDGTQIESA